MHHVYNPTSLQMDRQKVSFVFTVSFLNCIISRGQHCPRLTLKARIDSLLSNQKSYSSAVVGDIVDCAPSYIFI